MDCRPYRTIDRGQAEEEGEDGREIARGRLLVRGVVSARGHMMMGRRMVLEGGGGVPSLRVGTDQVEEEEEDGKGAPLMEVMAMARREEGGELTMGMKVE
jgi:hypothetical protein